MQRRISRSLIASAAALVAVGLVGCSSGGSGDSSSSAPHHHDMELTSSHDPLTILIGSSGDAETAAVKDAVAAWSATSDNKATVVPANNLEQQLAQGFAAKKPADVFYLGTGSLAGYADNGSLLAYGDMLPNTSDFYPALLENFTYKGQLYCAPKDFSTLQLVINTEMWKAAGLTDADYPKTWDDLAAVAKKLTTPSRTGFVIDGQYERLGAFMAEAGGTLMNADGTKATANSAANVTALEFAKSMLTAGSMKFSSDIGAGWSGEAFGKGQTAMTIQGNWITGAMKSDYPSVAYRVIPLPAGPKGDGTLQFSNCWGIAADSPNQKAALSLVEELTSKGDQIAFAKAFGPMPSIKSAAAAWKGQFPQYSAFLDGAAYAHGVPTVKGSSDVITDLNGKLAQLKTQDPKTILDATQKNLQALLK